MNDHKKNEISTTQSSSSNATELNSDDLILTIDNGTQSIRALIFDLQGRLVAKNKVEIEPYFSEKPGWAEQHADYFWQMVSKACQELWLQEAVVQNKLKQKIVAFSVTTQRNSVVNLNEQGEPLRPMILWLDQRLADQPKKVPWYWRVLFRIAGQTNVINYFQRKAQANWVLEKQPEVWRDTKKFLLLSGYLTYQFTGKYIDSVANIVGYLPLDYKKQQWAPASDWRWHAMPITKDMLPTLVKPGDKIGEITEAAAQATGIRAGTPMIAAASDKACEVLGSGCFEPTTASLSYGTTATINVNTSRYVEPQPFIPPYPSAIPGYYNSEVMIFRGFWMVSWFKQQFGLSEVLEANKQGMPAEALFDELVNQVPPGSMGLMLQPYWSPGIKNLEAKGAVIGFGDVHTRAHLYRSILEGLCYALREGKERLEKRQRKKITGLIVSGGGSQSKAAMQLTADIFNLPAHRPHTFETSGLGAAINVAVGLGYFKDYESAAKAMTHISETYLPNPEHVDLYDNLYRRVYKKMYQKLKKIYQEIKTITGYPE